MTEYNEPDEAAEADSESRAFKVRVDSTARIHWGDYVAYVERAAEVPPGHVDPEIMLTPDVHFNEGYKRMVAKNFGNPTYQPNEANVILIEQYVYGEIDVEPGESHAAVAERVAAYAQDIAKNLGPVDINEDDTSTEIMEGTPFYDIIAGMGPEQLRDFTPRGCKIIGIEGIDFIDQAERTYDV